MSTFKYGIDTLTVAKAIHLSIGKLVGIIDEKINIQFFDQIGHFPFNRNFLKIYLIVV